MEIHLGERGGGRDEKEETKEDESPLIPHVEKKKIQEVHKKSIVEIFCTALNPFMPSTHKKI